MTAARSSPIVLLRNARKLRLRTRLKGWFLQYQAPRLAALALLSAAGLLCQQSPVGDRFEAASIKPSGPQSARGSDGGPGHKDPGRFTYGKAEQLSMILMAWNVKPFQVSSKIPLDRDEFDLTAVVPAGATREQFRVMFQNFLVDRFHLRSHMESKKFPTSVLTVSKTGLKIKDSGGDPARFPTLPAGLPGFTSTMSAVGSSVVVRMRAQQQPISTLADMLHPPNNMPVRDATGLTGKYDFTLEYIWQQSAERNDQTDFIPDLATALQRQLGLQLTERPEPFDVVVIDSIDRLPTDN